MLTFSGAIHCNSLESRGLCNLAYIYSLLHVFYLDKHYSMECPKDCLITDGCITTSVVELSPHKKVKVVHDAVDWHKDKFPRPSTVSTLCDGMKTMRLCTWYWEWQPWCSAQLTKRDMWQCHCIIPFHQ